MLDFITWRVNPEAFSIFGLEIRWYGIFWVIGLIVAIEIVAKIFKQERVPPKWFDKLFIYMTLSIIIGARLGHCLFYDPGYYLSHPLSILNIRQGGLASHGGVLGIIIGVLLFSKYVARISPLWTFDRVAVPAGFTAAMIRMGNLMNHEIYGHATNEPWGFRFIENIQEWLHGAAPIYSQPSHPTQIYEAISYLIIFAVAMVLFWKTDARYYRGLILGISMIWIFTMRFFIEFLKNTQEPFEVEMIHKIGINMGQLLSIPFIIWGIWLIWNALKKGQIIDKYVKN